MKSIREQVMSKKTEKETPIYPKTEDMFNECGGGYDYGDYNPRSYAAYENSYSHKTKAFSRPSSDQFTIAMTILNSEIGSFANETSPNHDETRAEIKATEIAYDRVKELIGKDFESKYSITYSATAGYDEYDVDLTLIPNNKPNGNSIPF